VSGRRILILILAGALLTALTAVAFWNPITATLCLLTALAGAFLSRLISGPAASANQSTNNPTSNSQTSLRTRDTDKQVAPRELLDATMNSMREGVLILDRDMRILAANPAAYEVFASDDSQIESMLLAEVTRNPQIHEAFRSALEEGRRVDTKVEMRRGDRRVFDLRVAPRYLTGVDSARGAIGVFFDITQLERLERVRQEFLSNVSHELRTPLTAIIAFVDTLEEGAIDDKENNRRFLQVIRRNAERMHNLIDDILELSSIEAGMIEVEPRHIGLGTVVDDVITTLAARANPNAIKLTNGITNGVTVFADGRRLEQMLTNLVDNAIKFNREDGQVVIRHESTNETDRITVSDTGDGITGDHIERIFERFYRVDRARSREVGGTGLGLAIVKHLAKAHGGEATVSSIPGEGTTFTIELPKEATKNDD
jgi:two-component system phosphate regulon sensor histidine kinase PhoR